MKVALISAIYVVQNNLLFFAASNLDVGTFQVSYQAKILTGAIFFVFILDTKLVATQWMAIVTLFSGVVMVKLADLDTGGPKVKMVPANGVNVTATGWSAPGNEVQVWKFYKLYIF